MNVNIPFDIIYRMEEVLHEIETAVGMCNRILMSPTLPVYTAHTSRILGVYLGCLLLALVSMGASTTTIVWAGVFSSYVLAGINEIGCLSEFSALPSFDLMQIILFRFTYSLYI